MKIRSVAALMALTFALMAGSASAQNSTQLDRDSSDLNKMVHKLGRGIVNVLTCWMEVPVHISREWRKTDPVSGIVVGSLVGAANGFARLASGAFEVVTFPLPVPNDYEPLLEPEFIITEAWGDPIPGFNEFDANDPLVQSGGPTYPRRFRF